VSFIPRVVLVPADGVNRDLRFPLAGAGEQLDYAFDFSGWLATLDRIANATLEAGPGLALGAVGFTRRGVTARLGPALFAGVFVIACSIVTPQGRQKAVSATVTLE
jgi:hypothetical protein